MSFCCHGLSGFNLLALCFCRRNRIRPAQPTASAPVTTHIRTETSVGTATRTRMAAPMQDRIRPAQPTVSVPVTAHIRTETSVGTATRTRMAAPMQVVIPLPAARAVPALDVQSAAREGGEAATAGSPIAALLSTRSRAMPELEATNAESPVWRGAAEADGGAAATPAMTPIPPEEPPASTHVDTLCARLQASRARLHNTRLVLKQLQKKPADEASLSSAPGAAAAGDEAAHEAANIEDNVVPTTITPIRTQPSLTIQGNDAWTVDCVRNSAADYECRLKGTQLKSALTTQRMSNRLSNGERGSARWSARSSFRSSFRSSAALSARSSAAQQYSEEVSGGV